MSHRDIFYFRKVTDAARQDNSTRTLEKYGLILWVFSFYERILDDRAIRKLGRADERRKSRPYCRAERPDHTKPLLGSQPFHKARIHNVVLAQPGAPDGSHPLCRARTFPPCRRHTVTLMRKEDGFPKGEEPWVPHPLAFVLLLRGTLWNQKMPLWGVFPQGCGRLARPSHERRTGCGVSRYGKNALGVFHERA